MEDIVPAPDMTLEEIREAATRRLAVVRQAKQEYDQLERALDALNGVPAAQAPYGFKRDGTPRKRPGRQRTNHDTPAPGN